MDKSSVINAILSGDVETLARHKVSKSVAIALQDDKTINRPLVDFVRRTRCAERQPPAWTHEERDEYISIIRNSSVYQSDPDGVEIYIRDVLMHRN